MKASFHVVFDAKIGYVWDPKTKEGRQGVQSVRAKRMTQSVPDIKGGEIAVHFEVNLPEAAFMRLMPEVEVEIADGHWTSQPVKVLVQPPPEEVEQ